MCCIKACWTVSPRETYLNLKKLPKRIFKIFSSEEVNSEAKRLHWGRCMWQFEIGCSLFDGDWELTKEEIYYSHHTNYTVESHAIAICSLTNLCTDGEAFVTPHVQRYTQLIFQILNHQLSFTTFTVFTQQLS